MVPGCDIHCDTAQAHHLAELIENDRCVSFDPDFPSILSNPTELGSSCSRANHLSQIPRNSTTIFRVNHRHPEVRRLSPLAYAVAENSFNVLADESQSQRRFRPAVHFPDDTG